MKMLEDLAEVVRLRLGGNATDEDVKRLNQAARDYIEDHHAAIADMAKRLEAADMDAARWRFVESNPWRAIDALRDGCSVKPAYWRAEAKAAIDDAMQETER